MLNIDFQLVRVFFTFLVPCLCSIYEYSEFIIHHLNVEGWNFALSKALMGQDIELDFLAEIGSSQAPDMYVLKF